MFRDIRESPMSSVIFIENSMISHMSVTFTSGLSGGFRGGSGGSLEPPSGTKIFQFHGEIYEKSGKMMDLTPHPVRNPGSAPGGKPVMSKFVDKFYLEVIIFKK